MLSTLLNKIKSGNSRTATIKSNIIGSLFIKGCSIVISLLLVPMTLGYVSSELYGIWLTLSSITMWLNFFDVGFTLGLKNKLAEAIALKDYTRGKYLVSTTYFMMILIFIPLCFVLLLAIPHINWATFLNVNAIYNDEIIKALYVLVVCFCLQMIVNVLTAVVAAYQKVALSSLFPVVGHLFSLIIIIFLTKLCPPSLTALALAISTMPVLVVLIASIILFSSKFKQIAPSLKCIRKEYINDLFSLGMKFFLIQIQVVVMFQCTNILISNVSGPNDVTNYNIAYKYLGVAMMIYSIILNPLWPAFTDAYTKKDFVWMKRIYRKLTYVYLISAVGLIFMLLLSPIMYNLWIGEKADVPFSMTFAVMLYMLIFNWDSLQVQLINGIGSITLQTYVTLIGLILHIPLSLCLGKYFGAIGVLMSMCIINFIYSTFFTIQINKIINRKARGIWIK